MAFTEIKSIFCTSNRKEQWGPRKEVCLYDITVHIPNAG